MAHKQFISLDWASWPKGSFNCCTVRIILSCWCTDWNYAPMHAHCAICYNRTELGSVRPERCALCRAIAELCTRLAVRSQERYTKSFLRHPSFTTNKRTPQTRVLLEKLTIPLLVKDFSHILRNPKLHCHVNHSPPLVSVLTQFNPFHVFSSYFYYFHIILPLKP